MGLEEEYPKSRLKFRKSLDKVLRHLPDLPASDRERITMALESASEKAVDLAEIVQRLAEEAHPPSEVAELLIAFQLTAESIRGSTGILDDKLYELAERLKAAATTR